jgi:hypothetical protein
MAGAISDAERKGFHAKDAKEEGREGREVLGVVEAVPSARRSRGPVRRSRNDIFARRRGDAEEKGV